MRDSGQSDADYLLTRKAQPGLLHLAGKPDKVTLRKLNRLMGVIGMIDSIGA